MRYSSQIFITERSIDMPVIDFHTHVFPEAIAEKTISMLAQKSNSQPFGNGTFSSLLSNMQTSGVTHSVTLPVVTRPKQFDSILKYAIACNEHPQIFAFGGKMQKFAGISAPIMPKDVEHNQLSTGGNALEQQSYSQFPQSFPHRYVNRITADKP